MGKHYTHDGKRSWWDGSVATLCGLRLESGTFRETWFNGATCPACRAVKKQRRK